jgi:hypothetical protein
MAANTPRAAVIGCLIGGAFAFFIGIPFTYVGAILRYVQKRTCATSHIVCYDSLSSK